MIPRQHLDLSHGDRRLLLHEAQVGHFDPAVELVSRLTRQSAVKVVVATRLALADPVDHLTGLEL
jgi:hypothetical protein